MRWQTPWAWLGLLTLVLPVLVHLFSRRQTRIEPFPTLRFIDVSRLLPTRRTQLTDVLLLLVRLLVLATAVAALAQPLFRNHRSSNVIASAVIVDTTALGADSTGRARVDATVREVIAASTAQLRTDTDAPADALAGSAAWLETQAGTRQLVVVSDFRDGTLDSLDLALLPRDISVRLILTGDTTSARASMALGSVWLAPSGASAPSVHSAVTGAVRSLGASALVDAIPPEARRVIVVASSDADSVSAWRRDARPLTQAWMGDVIARLRHDTTVVTTSAGSTVSDSTIAAPFTVIARTTSNAPVVAVAALGSASADTANASRLLVWTRTSATALTTASVLLGASRALEPRASATSGRATPDSAQLRRWEKAPAAAPVAATFPRSSDALTGASDARWFWVIVLLLLALETVVRRARSSDSAPATSNVAPTGAQDG